MDTLSRKHRLRQREQQQKYFENKENELLDRFDEIATTNSSSNHNNNHFQVDDDDREQFKVFKVIHTEKNNNHREQQQSSSVRQLETSVDWSASYADSERRDKNDRQREEQEQFPTIVYLQSASGASRTNSAQKRNEQSVISAREYCQPPNGECRRQAKRRVRELEANSNATACTLLGCSTTRSSGDSSGFVSESSHLGSSSRRGKVLDELDRLLKDERRMLADRIGYVSPSDSHLSADLIETSMAPDSTLTRSAEYDYSTLCRDEFSSFIQTFGQTEAQMSPPSDLPETTKMLIVPGGGEKWLSSVEGEAFTRTSAGPTLIGVHEEANQSEQKRRPQSSDLRAAGGNDEHSNHDQLSTIGFSDDEDNLADEDDDDEDDDNDEQLAAYYREPPARLEATSEIKPSRANNDDLNELLSVYLGRLESLLRLRKGDNSVSFEEAFGDSREPKIVVSEEFRTKVEFSPLKRSESSARVVQEMEMIENLPIRDNEEEGEEVEQATVIATKITRDNFLSILEAPQTSADLNWFHSSNRLSSLSPSSANTLAFLEQSLLRRLIEDRELVGENEGEKISQNLVSSIRRHLSEFIDTYERYQSELATRTSFATDWHQNWSFATPKRPNDEVELNSEQFRYADSASNLNSKKRAKLAHEPASLSANKHDQLDLIKYSTLIMDKCKPVRVNYLEPKQEQLDEIDKLYEVEEDRANELYARAVELSGQLDACRLLLRCDIDIDSDDDVTKLTCTGRQRRNGKLECNKESGRTLSVNYATTSSLGSCCNSRFEFAAYGYSFEMPVSTLAIDASRRRIELLARLKEKILRKFGEFPHKPVPENLHAHRRQLAAQVNPFANDDNDDGDGDTEKHANFTSATAMKLLKRLRLRPIGQQPVKFLVGLSNVELIQRTSGNYLPVIQFCAKISGSLPIGIRWFRADEEISSLKVEAASRRQRRQHLRIRKSNQRSESVPTIDWPIELEANYDYEYQTEWSSWYRFRRFRGEIIFEIRNAHLEMDFGQSYRCLISNSCSMEESSFSLTRRQCEPERKREGGKKRLLNGERRNLLLRTWSQRTLHRPPPSTADLQVESDPLDSRQQEEAARSTFQIERKSPANTLASRLEETPNVADQFGEDFPYHPKNLLKRLKENKFTSSTLIRRANQPQFEQQQHHQSMADRCFTVGQIAMQVENEENEEPATSVCSRLTSCETATEPLESCQTASSLATMSAKDQDEDKDRDKKEVGAKLEKCKAETSAEIRARPRSTRPKQVEPAVELEQIAANQAEVSSCSNEQRDKHPIANRRTPREGKSNLHPGRREYQVKQEINTAKEELSRVGAELGGPISRAPSADCDLG